MATTELDRNVRRVGREWTGVDDRGGVGLHGGSQALEIGREWTGGRGTGEN